MLHTEQIPSLLSQCFDETEWTPNYPMYPKVKLIKSKFKKEWTNDKQGLSKIRLKKDSFPHSFESNIMEYEKADEIAKSFYKDKICVVIQQLTEHNCIEENTASIVVEASDALKFFDNKKWFSIINIENIFANQVSKYKDMLVAYNDEGKLKAQFALDELLILQNAIRKSSYKFLFDEKLLND